MQIPIRIKLVWTPERKVALTGKHNIRSHVLIVAGIIECLN